MPISPIPAVLSPQPYPREALWARFIAPFLEGAEGYLRNITVPHEARLADLVPIGSTVANYEYDGGQVLLAETSTVAYLIMRWGSSASANIRASDPEAIEKATAELTSRFPAPADDDTVSIGFWQISNGPYLTTRSIAAPGAEIEPNYPAPVWHEFAALRDTELSLDGGRIILWHGPPGTGKTTAIRALARQWKERVAVQLVLDPEAIFGSSAALMEILLDDRDEDDERWRLLVVEDADELIRSDAKDRVGQALSRLLNLSDGILGQGLRVAVLITTNEPITRLHPALVRPGRCLAETEFRRFTRAEAIERIDQTLPSGASFSLAELTAIERGEAPPEPDADPPGQYL